MKNPSRFLLLSLLILPVMAFSHVENGTGGNGFLAGMLHPVTGLDHVIAMVAVGLWGAQLKAPAL